MGKAISYKPEITGARVLVMDTDRAFVDDIRKGLGALGAEVSSAKTPADAERQYKKSPFNALLASISLMDEDAAGFIMRFKEHNPGGMFFLVLEEGMTVTSPDPSSLIVEDYLQKPIDALRMGMMLETQKSRALALPDPVISQARPYFQFRSEAMRLALMRLPKIASSNQSVLISGETGTGKEIISRAIHVMSHRASGPFVAVNCGAIPEGLIEGELFGHERGSFTGAHRLRKGKFETAQMGTLLLDEIGDMPLHLQVKLLRALEEGAIYRVGAEEPIAVDVRVIAATSRDLTKAVSEGLFREDLYYRLNILRIHLPPLKDRTEDIALLSTYFMHRALAELKAPEPYPSLSSATIRLLESLPWKGNVRELRNIMTRVATFLPATARQVLPMHVLPHLESEPQDGFKSLKEDQRPEPRPESRPVRNPERIDAGIFIPAGSTLEDAERMLIDNALVKAGGNRTKAAKALGIGLRTIRRKLNEK